MLEHFGPEWSDDKVWPFYDDDKVELLGFVAAYDAGVYFVYEWDDFCAEWEIKQTFDSYRTLMTFVRQELRARRDTLKEEAACIDAYLKGVR